MKHIDPWTENWPDAVDLSVVMDCLGCHPGDFIDAHTIVTGVRLEELGPVFLWGVFKTSWRTVKVIVETEAVFSFDE
jgi:hypothetical protein